MKKGDLLLAQEIKQKLIDFSAHIALPGIANTRHLACLVEQIIDSTRRIKYIEIIRDQKFTSAIADPSKTYFNPLKAAIWYKEQGNIDEAFWLIFLFVHFGKHQNYGWELIRAVYGSLSTGQVWDWATISSNPYPFIVWLSQNEVALRSKGRFGNHRKYENLRAYHPTGTGAIISSYIEWVNQYGSHSQLLQSAKNAVGNNPQVLFNYLYRQMDDVIRFGRTAKFDYLTMIGKIGLENIVPGSAYLKEATGPLLGAKLLFGGDTEASIRPQILEANLSELNEYLDLYFGWQVLEDSLCNWQKKPDQYVHFKG